jgi:hypothetical protein
MIHIDRKSWTVQSMPELDELDRSATTAPTINIGIKYTTELNRSISKLFSKTYYMIYNINNYLHIKMNW